MGGADSGVVGGACGGAGEALIGAVDTDHLHTAPSLNVPNLLVTSRGALRLGAATAKVHAPTTC